MPITTVVKKKNEYPVSKVYSLLEPGPVVMVTTAHEGRFNVMTMSWHTMMEFVPPIIGCVISNRNYTFNILKRTKECVIAIPSADLAKKVVRVGITSGKNIDKFSSIGFTAEPASLIKAPLIAECFANIECKIADTVLVDKYNFFILKAVKLWISQKEAQTIHHRGHGIFLVDGEKIRIPFKSIEP